MTLKTIANIGVGEEGEEEGRGGGEVTQQIFSPVKKVVAACEKKPTQD